MPNTCRNIDPQQPVKLSQRDRGAEVLGEPPSRDYREVSVDRSTASRTQTPQKAGMVGKPAVSPRKTTNNNENPEKLKGPAPTCGPVSKPLPCDASEPGPEAPGPAPGQPRFGDWRHPFSGPIETTQIGCCPYGPTWSPRDRRGRSTWVRLTIRLGPRNMT